MERIDKIKMVVERTIYMQRIGEEHYKMWTLG